MGKDCFLWLDLKNNVKRWI